MAERREKFRPPQKPEKGSLRRRQRKLEKKRNAQGARDESLIYVQIFEDGRRYETRTSLKMSMRTPWSKPNPEEIRSVIPGSVLSFFVKEGDPVTKDQELMVYEAMKMHNVIRAPFSGVVEQIVVKTGDKLPKGALMMVIRSTELPDGVEPVAPEHYFEDFE